jgi:hypothetical protein
MDYGHLHVSSISCSFSGGVTQEVFGIFWLEYLFLVQVIFLVFSFLLLFLLTC